MRFRATAALFLCLSGGTHGFAQKPTPSEIERAVEEFKLETRNLGLRSDSPAKAKPSGSRLEWHGRLFENFRNDLLDAVPHEIVQRGGDKGFLRRNQFGLNLAGPVVLPR